MFWDSAPISGPKIREQMMYLGHRRSTSQKALKGLREKGILCLIDRQYRLIDSPAHPLELGAPIVFLPGTRSQKVGHIVEMKELKQGGGGIHPIAALSNGQTMFVNSAMAKVDLSQKSKEDHSGWLLRQLCDAVDKTTAVSVSEICLKAFQDGIPQISTVIKDSVRSGLIRRGRRRAFGFVSIESVYWQNI
jgi:biotin operon repressor